MGGFQRVFQIMNMAPNTANAFQIRAPFPCLQALFIARELLRHKANLSRQNNCLAQAEKQKITCNRRAIA
jgi:hypothetical protein